MAEDEYSEGEEYPNDGEETLPGGERVRKLKLQHRIGEGEATVSLSADQVRARSDRRKKPLRMRRMPSQQPEEGRKPMRKLRITQVADGRNSVVEENDEAEAIELAAPPSRGGAATVGPPEMELDEASTTVLNIVEPGIEDLDEAKLQVVADSGKATPEPPAIDGPPTVDTPSHDDSPFEPESVDFGGELPATPPDPSPEELPLNVPLAALPTEADDRSTVVLDLADIQIGEHNDYYRYHSFATLGVGGNGTVQACIDPHLGREVALKVLHPKLREDMKAQRRFIREAHIMALIEHPNVLPLHEMGKREDGTVYFTMKRIRGECLHDIINGLKVGDSAYCEAYPLHRMVDIFASIGHAVAFAHSRHIIHRDLKPENIYIGSFGEVQVCDWGLARMLGDVEQEELQGVTMDGTVMGTPHYMAPEQISGRISELDERTDIYALGVILYQMLTFNRPFTGDSIGSIMDAVLKQDQVPPSKKAPAQRIPLELDAICAEAMHKEQVDRYQSVHDLLADISNWQVGRPVSVCPVSPLRRAWKWCQRHPVFACTMTAFVIAFFVATIAAQMVDNVGSSAAIDRAVPFLDEGLSQYARKTEIYNELTTLRQTRNVAEVSETERQLEAQLESLHRSSEDQLRAVEAFYQMVENKDDPAWQDVIGRIYKARKDYAMLTGDAKQFMASSSVARRESPAAIQKIVQSVRSEGTLSVQSEPPGATVTLHALTPDERGIMNRGPAEALGNTPVSARALAKGSYLLIIEADGRPPVHAPVFVDHGESEIASVNIPDSVPEGMVYIPAGRFLTGGDPGNQFRLHQTHLDAYFIRQKEVTFREYFEFWESSEGGNSEAKYTPQIRFSRDIIEFIPTWDENATIHPSLRWEFPVVGITQHAAERYCHWLSRKISRDCLLPTAQQWEKAARGVDGREFVWGDEFLPDLALSLENDAGIARFPVFAPPAAFPGDVSVYGVFDMAGNVREWTRSAFQRDSPFFQIKGASASTDQSFMRCATASEAAVVPTDVGFRYVITLDR